MNIIEKFRELSKQVNDKEMQDRIKFIHEQNKQRQIKKLLTVIRTTSDINVVNVVYDKLVELGHTYTPPFANVSIHRYILKSAKPYVKSVL